MRRVRLTARELPGTAWSTAKKISEQQKDKRLTSDFAFGEKGKESLRLRLTRGRASPVVGPTARPSRASPAPRGRASPVVGPSARPSPAPPAPTITTPPTSNQEQKRRSWQEERFEPKKKDKTKRKREAATTKGRGRLQLSPCRPPLPSPYAGSPITHRLARPLSPKQNEDAEPQTEEAGKKDVSQQKKTNAQREQNQAT